MKWPLAHKMSILIVDEGKMRRSIRDMLKENKQGKYFFESSNGKDAWEFLERCREPLHLIVSGLNMPKMNGTVLLSRVRASDKYQDIPFLIVTSEADKVSVANAAENKVDAYLTKPITTEKLKERIAELVENASNPGTLSKQLKKAQKMVKKGKIKIAIKEMQKAVRENHLASRPIRELGLLYLKQKKRQEGLLCFQQATDLNELDIASFHHMGQTYYEMKMVDEAISSYSKAMDINPRHSDRVMSFAGVLLKENRRDDAEKILTQAMDGCGSDLYMHEDLIEMCYESGLEKLAAKATKDLLKKDPSRTYLNSRENFALARSGEEVAPESPAPGQTVDDPFGDDIDLLLTLAGSYVDLKDFDKAKEMAEQALKVDPDHEEAQEILAQCLSEEEESSGT